MQTYLAADSRLFRETLLRTYEQTFDCPEVNGVRTIDEIIAGHQAQGKHDPQRWWLAFEAGQPVGTLLLTELPESREWDLSYVGIVPEARRRGLGRQLVCRALREAWAGKASQLTLSVDVRNQPARKLYRALGFESYEAARFFWQSGNLPELGTIFSHVPREESSAERSRRCTLLCSRPSTAVPACRLP